MLRGSEKFYITQRKIFPPPLVFLCNYFKNNAPGGRQTRVMQALRVSWTLAEFPLIEKGSACYSPWTDVISCCS